MIGKEILNYRITSVIGKGGMGTVYMAEHTLIQGKKAAIKVINANMSNGFTKELLAEEAERLAELDHPNIVKFLNFDIDKQGVVYLLLEYAEGMNLDKYIKDKNGLLVESRIYDFFAPILDGIGNAHQHTRKDENGKEILDPIIHCDIKPANIVLKVDEKGKPRRITILDFGIAKMMSKQKNGSTHGMIMGTPSYMSPEQAKGEDVDTRSDIYSLGVLLHQMLTGKAPYDTTTLKPVEIMEKVKNEPLPRIKTFYAGNPHTDKLQAIIDKATKKNPDERFQTCEEFKKALYRAIYPYKVPIWAKIAAVVVFLALVGGGLYIWDYNRIKVSYYKDYVERWGIPEGIGEISSSEHEHMHRAYKFVECKRKLLSVTHVNSADKPIEDEYLEHKDRPIDQSFSYTEEGKISRVTVKDRSGKVLYVKSYNDKLNQMTYLFDDEFGTERALNSQTVGYEHLQDVNFSTHGKISRHLIDYDKNGFISKIQFVGLGNNKTCDQNGIYGVTYDVDEKGRVTEVHYIGIAGKAQSTKWGLSVKKFYYDSEDNFVKAEYQTIDGKPATDDTNGIFVYVFKYNEDGNLEYSLHQDADGNPMIPQISQEEEGKVITHKMNNVAGFHRLYDEHGFTIREEYLGVDGMPMFVPNIGCAYEEDEYDANGFPIRMSYFDTNGTLVDNRAGIATISLRNDENGNPLEAWFFNQAGDTCNIRMYGFAGKICEYDSIGNLMKEVFYGTDNKPCLSTNGAAGGIYSYDDRNLLTNITYLGTDLQPSANNQGVINLHYEYDPRGNQTQMLYYGKDGKTLKMSNEGFAEKRIEYDEKGNPTEFSYYDAKGKLTIPSAIHFAKMKIAYDENGNVKSVRCYDTTNHLMIAGGKIGGIAGFDRTCDKRGNILEEKPIGTDGNVMTSDLKLIIRYKYDEFNHPIERAFFNKSGATVNLVNIHKEIDDYNSYGQKIKQSFYDVNGNLTCPSGDYWAIMTAEYNSRGLATKISVFGTDKKLVKCKQGWSISTAEYDNMGNVTKQCYFDIHNNPTDTMDIAPVWLYQYDKWGNQTYVAVKDSKGRFVNNRQFGCAIARKEFDPNRNQTSESYFDTKDKATTNQFGFHKFIAKYDTHNRRIETAYYDTKEKPTIIIQGFHKEKAKYDEHTGYQTEQTLFDIDGNPVNCNEGWQKCIMIYNENGDLTERTYYRADGVYMVTQKREGTEWVTTDVSWTLKAQGMMQELPRTEGPITIESLSITGDNSCEIRYSVPFTTSELNSDELSQLKGFVDNMTKYIETNLDHKPYVTGTLYDKYRNKIYSVKY